MPSIHVEMCFSTRPASRNSCSNEMLLQHDCPRGPDGQMSKSAARREDGSVDPVTRSLGGRESARR